MKKVKNMRKANADIVPIKVLKVLSEETDSAHPLTAAELGGILDEAGLPSQRRTIYRAVSVLNENGFQINYTRSKEKSGYYAEHLFTLGEVNFLANECACSTALSNTNSKNMIAKAEQLLSIHDRAAMCVQPLAAGKTLNQNVIEMTSLLLKAINSGSSVSFLYYDYTVTRAKRYRRQSGRYHGVPYAVISENGRSYVVIHSDSHHDFANYRIDKMDDLAIGERADEIHPFNLEDHLRSSFMMYHGDATSVTVRFSLDLASIVMDRFGKDDMIITSVDQESFTASIRTTITPPLKSWLLQFGDKVTVLYPRQLIDSLLETADMLIRKYKEQGENNERENQTTAENH